MNGVGNPWHPCSWEDGELHHDGTWVSGMWYEWLDIFDNREVARIAEDCLEDHFVPDTKVIKEENLIAFRLLNVES